MNELIPAIVQDATIGTVLMVGYMNEEAIKRTEESGWVTFYSRSKERLWTKGESSGNRLRFVSAEFDCDRDALLVQAEPLGPVCHLERTSCFAAAPTFSGESILTDLQRVIRSRRVEPVDGSHTSDLFRQGRARIAQKFGEEAIELIIAAMSGTGIREEAADMVFHVLVLLEEVGVEFAEVTAVLEERAESRRTAP